ILGYSLAIALAQFLVLGRMLDRIHHRHRLTEIRVESAVGSREDTDVFGDGLGNSVYCEAATAWAVANGIDCRRMPAAGAVSQSASPVGIPSSLYRKLRKRAGVLRGNIVRSALIQLLLVLWALARRREIVVFTNCAERIPPRDANGPSRSAVV